MYWTSRRNSGCQSSPLCRHTFLFHLAQKSGASGNSCSPTGRTNVLIQQLPQGALFQHWWFHIRGGCSWWNGHQVALQVFSLQHPHLHPKRWCNPFQTIISHGTNSLCAPCGYTLISNDCWYHCCGYLLLLRGYLVFIRSLTVSL